MALNVPNSSSAKIFETCIMFIFYEVLKIKNFIRVVLKTLDKDYLYIILVKFIPQNIENHLYLFTMKLLLIEKMLLSENNGLKLVGVATS